MCALLYNEWFVTGASQILHARLERAFKIPSPIDIRWMQVAYVVAAAVFFGAAYVVGSSARLDRLTRRAGIQKLLLVLTAAFVCIYTLECALRPFAAQLKKGTSLFVKDDELGWRLRANATESWDGVVMRTNARGLRGPEVPYDRGNAPRIMYLGDSVTIGYRIARDEDTWPFALEAILEQELGRDVESVNASVDGYSPWQQRIYLENEGVRYAPDLVVVGFVLNDVTERFQLQRFGGTQEGYQLTNSYYSWLDKLLARSGLVYQVRNITREVKARRRLGEDPRLGAVQQQLVEVRTLVDKPNSPGVVQAWEFVFDELDAIRATCIQRDMDLAIVIFPFAFQFADPDSLSAPQRTLSNWAQANGVPVFDLLPSLYRFKNDNSVPADSLFFDDDHPTVYGSHIIADTLAAFVGDLLKARSD